MPPTAKPVCKQCDADARRGTAAKKKADSTDVLASNDTAEACAKENPEEHSCHKASEEDGDVDNGLPPAFSFIKSGGCLYTFFGLSQNADDEAIKKQYRKLALRYHPDRHSNLPAEDLENYKSKFQQYALVYEVLSSKEKRALYDRTGSISDLFLDSVDDYASYFKNLYESLVTAETIQNFKQEYQGSEEEKNDLVQSYLDNKGDMDRIMEEIPCSTIQDDEQRLRSVIEKLVSEGVIPKFKFFFNESKQKRTRRLQAALAEEKEAEEAARVLGFKNKLKNQGESDKQLAALIASKQKQREIQMDSFLDNLAQKYANQEPKPQKVKEKVAVSSRSNCVGSSSKSRDPLDEVLEMKEKSSRAEAEELLAAKVASRRSQPRTESDSKSTPNASVSKITIKKRRADDSTTAANPKIPAAATKKPRKK